MTQTGRRVFLARDLLAQLGVYLGEVALVEVEVRHLQVHSHE